MAKNAAATPNTKTGQVEELQLLLEVSQILDSCTDLREAIEPVLALITDSKGMERGTVTIVNPGTQTVEIEAAYGLSKSQQERGRYKSGEGITGRVLETGKPSVVPRVSEEPLFLNRTGARKNLRHELSFLCVPIRIGREVVGTLSFDCPYRPERRLEDDLRILTIVAAVLAQAVRLRQAMREEQRRLIEENTRLQGELRERFRPTNLIGASAEMGSVLDLVEQVSRSNATVLIRGESGTGKELVAHTIHLNSLRAGQPYVKVNCAALPEGVIESELFGHERGAFTGAVALHKGRFELATGGTIFLDEIGYVSLTTQVKLLRVLQEREFERVGGTRTIPCDVRVIAATNRNLEELMVSGTFLKDLYYRLNVFQVSVPPLRERPEDILPLAAGMLALLDRRKAILGFTEEAKAALQGYAWPGNVRELRNAVERAVILCPGDQVGVEHLPSGLSPRAASVELGGPVSLERIEEFHIRRVLASTHSLEEAADVLGIDAATLWRRRKKYGI